MAIFKARLLREDIWSDIQHLFDLQLKDEAYALLLEVLCPEPMFFHNLNYSKEVNTFNQASDAFIQLAAMCGLENQISKIFRKHDDTVLVTFSLGEYVLTRYTFDLSGGGDLRGIDRYGAVDDDLTDVSAGDIRR